MECVLNSRKSNRIEMECRGGREWKQIEVSGTHIIRDEREEEPA